MKTGNSCGFAEFWDFEEKNPPTLLNKLPLNS